MPCLSLLRLLTILLAVTGLARAASPSEGSEPPISADEQAQGFRNGRIIVKLREDSATATAAVREDFETRSGVTRRRRFEHLNGQQVLEFDRARSVTALVKELRATGRYEFVEPDRIIHALVTPNDPNFSQQWSLNNTGQNGGTVGADIGAGAAWSTPSAADASSVVVAVLDSGIRLTHEDLAANLWTNPSPSTTTYPNDLHGINATLASSNAASGVPTDDFGHGTHVSGIIGATGNNGLGISGVAWKAKIMALKFADASGLGSESAEIACINYAIAHQVKVINYSYGSNHYSNSEFAALQSARTAGIIFVVAAGNDALTVEKDADYPAGYLLDNIVAVAATTRTDTLASFSNYGSGLVDLAAPGSEIVSTYNVSDTSYASLSGTSMAAPHVTGAVALLLAKFPNDTPRQIINRLLRSTTKLPNLSGVVQSGGRLNLASALASTDRRPFNDDFANRAALSGANVRVRSNNTDATLETAAGEVAPGGVTGGHSLWWSWTAPTTSTVVFDTVDTGFDTTVAVYTGNAFPLTLVDTNDNASSSVVTSRVSINVTAGTTYQIAVDGKAGAVGQIALRVGTVPANDNFANAQPVAGTSFRVTGSTLAASAEVGEPAHASTSGKHSVWYRWTAPSSGRFQLAAVSASSNTIAAVYTGSTVSALTLVASNDNSISYNFDSLVSFTATAGTTYSFAVDGVETDGGDFTLTLNDSLWQYPAEDEVTSSPAIDSTGAAYFGSSDGYLYAVNASGTLKWNASVGTSVTLSTPAIAPDGTVYVGTDDDYLYAVNGTTGTRKWRYLASTPIISSPAIGADGTVYLRDDTNLIALTSGATAATREWSFPLNGSTYSSPSIAPDGTIYVGGISGAVYAINPDGTQKWRFTADGDVFTTPAIATDGTVYFATLSGSMYAVTAAGAQRWVWKTPDSTAITSSPALAVDGTLYFGGYDHKLHALGSNGVEKWSYTVGAEMRASSPAVAADGTVYFGCYDNFLYAVNASGALVRTYPTAGIIRSSPAIFSGRLYFGSSDYKLYAFNIGQNAAASAWPMFHQNETRVGHVVGIVGITTQPVSQSVAVGGSTTLSVVATGSGALSYQWNKNGVAIAGATSSTLTLSNASAATAGSYTVVVTNALGSVTSSAANLTVGTSAASKLSNLSARAVAGPGDQTLIVGFVISGGNKTILTRGIGPSLGTLFNLTGVLADPQLSVYDGSTVLQTNDNWGGTTSLTSTFASLGAFAITPASKDAAILTTLPAKNYTAQVTGAGGGVALAEIYDADGVSLSRLTNLSARAQVGTDGNVLIAGFVISGTSPKQVLIRGIGPTLTTFGLTGVLADPQLTLYDGNNAVVGTNNDWGGTAALTNAMTAVGAFSLSPASKDAAMLITLSPGAYTAQVSGVGATTGVAIVEVYEVP